MKKSYNINGREIVVEDGIVKIGNKKLNGFDILAISQAPKSVQQAVRKAGIDPSTRVYFGGVVLPREIAQEALDQRAKIATEEKRALAANVPGLDILRDAACDIERYRREFDQMMEDERNDGANPPKAPAGNIDTLCKQYPRAAAYLKAEAWEMADHYAKSSAGKKAKEAIAAGADLESTLATMEAEWSAYCDKHIWD